jgi:phosphatidylglycerol:prolipoprotein diacylglycerol transferase
MWKTLYEFDTGGTTVPMNSWGLMITLAFLAAAIVVHRRLPRVGIDPDGMVGMYLLAMFSGLVGARLLHFLAADFDRFRAHPGDFFNMGRGGFAFYGGFILAGVLCVTYVRVRGMDPWKVSDAVGPAVMLGLGIGRVGCFLAGCCHGKELVLPPGAVPLLPSDFGAAHGAGGQLWWLGQWPFVAELTHSGVGHNEQVVYPTQLFEFVACLAIFGITSWAWHRWRRFDGQIIAMVLLLYSAWRPINENLRGDTVRGVDHFGGLTTSQVISIPAAVIGVLVLVVGVFRGRRPETPWQAPRDVAEAISGSAPKL